MNLSERYNRLRIKREHLPQRCEICHQDDLFDAAKNFCQRCSTVNTIAFQQGESTNIEVSSPPNSQERKKIPLRRGPNKSWGDLFFELFFGIFTVVGFILTLFGGVRLIEITGLLPWLKSHLPWVRFILPFLALFYLLLSAWLGAVISITILETFAKLPGLFRSLLQRRKGS